MKPADFYRERLQTREKAAAELGRSAERFGCVRIVLFLAVLACGWFVLQEPSPSAWTLLIPT
ncbi:hypothetical protein, partial [Salmonella enterica]|uniref:hypothetical protein n=1 Tax=Salmonella enterica TaxID=28901 RepID=UPI003297D96C